MSDDRSDRGGRSPPENGGSDLGEERKVNIVNSYRSPSKERSRSRSPSTRKSKKKYYSRSRSRSRSHGRSRRSKRSRSRSSKRYKRYSRSYSRSASYSPSYRRGRGRTHSRSPMSNRRRHNGNRENPEPTRCLGVFGLSTYTTEDQLYYIFNKYGPVSSVQVVIDVKTGYSRGFAFVYFEKTDDAREAKEHCSGMDIDGRKIRVDYSITQRAHTPTPGIYMGKPTYYRRERNDWGGGRDYYGGGGGSYRSGRYRSPSPYYSKSSRRRYDRSRSRSYSPYY